jgi:hypothetical protein
LGTTSLTIASTTQIVGEVFGLGGYATCSTTVTAFTGSGAISGVVYLDNKPKNFAYDSGETIFKDRVIVLSGAKGATTTTNAQGMYAFTGLSAGAYRVAHTVQDGYVPATDNNSPVTLPLNNSSTTLNFGIQQTVVAEPSTPPPGTGSVTGVVYDDVNPSNFQYDTSEPVFANRTIVLSGPASLTTTTDSSGRYVFNGLYAGLYRVRHDVPTGYAARTDNNSPATVATSTVTTLNFGIKATAVSTTTQPASAP